MSTGQPIISRTEATLPLYFGIDVGGTNIKLGLVDDAGKTLAFEEIETEEPKGPQSAIGRMAAACQRLLVEAGVKPSEVVRAGLGTPGSMDIAKGMLLQPPNHPNWWNFPIRDRLSEALGIPVSYANDANAAAWGEFWIGSGEKHASMVLLTLGTGVGGGIIDDGHLVNGVNSFSGECGHVIVDSSPQARLCVWGGGRGHLEAYASASAVSARATEKLAQGAKSSLTELWKAGTKITAKRVFEAAEGGDEFAYSIIDETAWYLGVGITTIVHVVDPGLVVLGGAMNFGGPESSVGQRFLERVRQEFRELTFPNVAAGTHIDFATLGGDAGYLGAAGIARVDYQKQK